MKSGMKILSEEMNGEQKIISKKSFMMKILKKLKLFVKNTLEKMVNLKPYLKNVVHELVIYMIQQKNILVKKRKNNIFLFYLKKGELKHDT